jgi:hypothetical protein
MTARSDAYRAAEMKILSFGNLQLRTLEIWGSIVATTGAWKRTARRADLTRILHLFLDARLNVSTTFMICIRGRS